MPDHPLPTTDASALAPDLTGAQQRQRRAVAAPIIDGEVFVPGSLLPEHGVPYHITHVYRMVKRGEFPRPVRLSANRVAWKKSDLLAWRAARANRYVDLDST